MATPKVIELGKPETPDEGLRREVFSINGENYTMPEVVDGKLALTFMEKAAENEAAAGVWLLRTIFGREGYNALKENSTGKQLRAVLDVVADHVMGALEN